jgi:pimeloyl-ACP methyl ester carboxylesterase
MPTLELEGAQLAYRVDGNGPYLVLVHAGIADMRMWDPLVALLDHRFRIVRYDMRGHGDTTYDAGQSSDVDDLAALLAALEIDSCVLVGASFGGLVALAFATAHPDAVERLVVIDAPLPGHEWSERMQEFFRAENAALEAGRVETAVQLNVDLWVGSAAPDVRALVADMQERAFRLQLEAEPESPGLEPRLADITMPTTVVMGEHDVEDFIAIAHRLADELPAATLECVPRAGHLPALERPDAVAALIVSRR